MTSSSAPSSESRTHRGARWKGEVLSVVERGWRGARECSLTLDAMAIPVTHLIKGYLTAELRAMIHPYPLIRIVSVPRPLFRVGLWWALARQTLTRRLRWVLVDHERTLREISWWCRLWGVALVTIHERDDGYELLVGGQPRSLASVFTPPHGSPALQEGESILKRCPPKPPRRES